MQRPQGPTHLRLWAAQGAGSASDWSSPFHCDRTALFLTTPTRAESVRFRAAPVVTAFDLLFVVCCYVDRLTFSVSNVAQQRRRVALLERRGSVWRGRLPGRLSCSMLRCDLLTVGQAASINGEPGGSSPAGAGRGLQHHPPSGERGTALLRNCAGQTERDDAASCGRSPVALGGVCMYEIEKAANRNVCWAPR